MLNSFATARSPVFNAMFEHEMEESKKVSGTESLRCHSHSDSKEKVKFIENSIVLHGLRKIKVST